MLDRWLEEIGAGTPVTSWAEAGFAYHSRHYTFRAAVEILGAAATRIVAGLDQFTALMFSGDNGTIQFSGVPIVEDKPFRAVRDADTFTAVLRTISVFRMWLEALEPIGPVYPMGADQAANDSARLAMPRHNIFDAPAPQPADNPERVGCTQLRAAALFDPTVFRAFGQVMGMLSRSEAVYTDPAVVTNTRDVIRQHGIAAPFRQPTRENLLAVLKT